MALSIPQSHMRLLEERVYAVVTTVMPDGQPQSTVVWVDHDSQYVRINVAEGRQKLENLEQNPKITVMLVDPEDPYFWMEIRGEVAEMTDVGGYDHIEALSRKYMGRGYYGDFNTRTTRDQETRVIVKIRPTKVNTFPRKR